MWKSFHRNADSVLQISTDSAVLWKTKHMHIASIELGE